MKTDRIKCISMYGKEVFIRREKIIPRPSSYGVCGYKNSLLLIRLRNLDKFYFPGGGCRKGELTTDACIREVKEETGVDVKIKSLLKFTESFFYYDVLDEAYHLLSFFYEVVPLSTDISSSGLESDEEAVQPQWTDVSTLRPEDFQTPADSIFIEFIKS